jgi:opacity protein-like surface antigen
MSLMSAPILLSRALAVALCAPLLLAWTQNALAQSAPGYTPVFDQGLKTASLRLGPTSPTSTNGFAESAKAGPFMGLQYLYFPYDWIGIGADVGYHTFGKNANAIALDAIVRLNLLRERSWTPYLVGGAGHAQSSRTLPAAPGAASGTTEKGSGLSLLAAGGLEAFVFRGMSVSLEARYTEFRGGGGAVESLAYLLGVGFWFGYD